YQILSESPLKNVQDIRHIVLKTGAAGLQLALPENARLPLADILVANILATPLLTLAPALAHSVRPGGWIALSGILHHQEAEIHAAYEPYFDLAVAQHEEDWSLLYGQRNTGV
ncbi:50S ribosomal protein L11 methyltransferase, partial [Acidithiobacillus sp. PG05]|uniref:50S ribosomal protein L11 methyltransferase n=1 Tax=Acidithiobacillus sp. PG05 TaxID=2801581 RepID=UPI001F153C9A